MKMAFNKLVRDRIPEIIRAAGKQCAAEVLSEEDYQQALRQKLIEEAHEAATAIGDDLIKELTDLYEVIDGLMLVYHVDREAVVKIQEERRAERGGFNERLRLLWVETE
ncbi:MAG: nucleoside triphosphate pyrophosphohydrolase [Lyngbya sp. HA4199-MV5]|jgi:predicted house-cleaning noncanonical NTP pyrophosphatase (MazG superfamily)|nr:nucleoside triphosphate pyrophosphohydrolase [Lyngbya sp. HA4199-MV5]